MKNKLIPFLSLFISIIGQCLYADIEKTMTIYMNNGTEKEIRIPVPSEMTSRADEYAKAYTILYMEWWNAGVQFNLPYMFDISHFRNNTPPKRITAFAGDHAEYVFSMTGLTDKVEKEASDYLDNQTYIDNPPAKEVTVVIDKSNWYKATATIKVGVPERFQKRAKEYGEAYAKEYESTWNKILSNEDRFDDYYLPLRIRGTRSYIRKISIGADINAYVKKLFQDESLIEKMRSTMEEDILTYEAIMIEVRKKRAENKKRDDSFLDN